MVENEKPLGCWGWVVSMAFALVVTGAFVAVILYFFGQAFQGK